MTLTLVVFTFFTPFLNLMLLNLNRISSLETKHFTDFCWIQMCGCRHCVLDITSSFPNQPKLWVQFQVWWRKYCTLPKLSEELNLLPKQGQYRLSVFRTNWCPLQTSCC